MRLNSLSERWKQVREAKAQKPKKKSTSFVPAPPKVILVARTCHAPSVYHFAQMTTSLRKGESHIALVAKNMESRSAFPVENLMIFVPAKNGKAARVQTRIVKIRKTLGSNLVPWDVFLVIK
jgi:hypothetical protein